MGRFEWDGGDYEPAEYPNAEALFEARARTAIHSRRGRKALRELREALLALPKHELIEGAVCRFPKDEDGEPVYEEPTVAPGQLDFDGGVAAGTPKLEAGVCAVGAWVWWQKVKAGADPVKAFTELPSLDSDDEDGEGGEMFETAWLGQKHGLSYTLAWELASGNDERWVELTPEARWQAFVDWIDGVLAAPPLTRRGPVPKVHERLGRSWTC